MPNDDVTREFFEITNNLLNAGHRILVQKEDYKTPSIPAIWGMTHERGDVRRSRVGRFVLVELSMPDRAEPVKLELLTQEQRKNLVDALKNLALESCKRTGAPGNWIGIKDEHGTIPTNTFVIRPLTPFETESRVVDDGVHAGKRLFMIKAVRWVDGNTIAANGL
ncbi:hypothetical protein WMF26_26150 [Sorangium sp. So ce185]|uniref:hypothetical protein n=1 Tax=Sorangium sp. So ce185 TaxID=3133287 RepID=UPI003F604ED9